MSNPPEAPTAGPDPALTSASPVPGTLARAIAVAYAEFAQIGDDLRHFTVSVKDCEPGVAEVVFTPEWKAGDPRGGRNEYGFERHYHVRLDDGSLLRATLAR